MQLLNLKMLIGGAALLFMISSCADEEEMIPPNVAIENVASATGSWQRTFLDNFSNSGSFNNWSKTTRFDYNSNYCHYDASVPHISSYDNRNVLVLTATKSGNIWQSGHVKSNYSFKPGWNEEYRVSSSIKLIAKDGDNWRGFSGTYGVWPAFWTVQENSWPVQGEIDIFEGYSFGGHSNFASNLFYGHSSGQNLLGSTAERHYGVSEGWHTYDEYWKNENGWVTVTIKLDGQTKATYTNNDNGNLKLQNFGPHNIILNLNVGDNWGIFDNNRNNVMSKTMMWIDYVTVDKRTL
ncbi:MAG: hypothetical protein OCD76_05245 [Reichenbachiella sp.]